MLTVLENLEATEISDQKMEGAISIVRFYLAERLRIQHATQIDPDVRLAQRLLLWLLNVWPSREPSGLVSLPNIYQLVPNAIRDKKTAQRIVNILKNHGWLRETDGPRSSVGRCCVRRCGGW